MPKIAALISCLLIAASSNARACQLDLPGEPSSWEQKIDAADVVFVGTHLMLEGIGHGSETSDSPRGRDVFFPIVEMRALFPNAVFCAGHYHRQQVYEGVHIPGSLVQLTRGELDHRPGFLGLDV